MKMTKNHCHIILKFITLSLIFLFTSSCSIHTQKNKPIYGKSIYPALSTNYIYISNKKNHPELYNRKPYFILELEGGGMRGIIPLIILDDIEKKAHLPISQLFDLIVGTSTGTIISSMLALPNKYNKPKYSANDVLKLYSNLNNKVFYRPFWYKLQTLWGLIGPMYNRSQMNIILNELYGNTLLSDVLTHIVLTEYSYSLQRIFYFDSLLAKKNPNQNFYLKDVVGAGTASELIFSPYYYCNITKTFCDRGGDGGIAVNNPLMAAYLYARHNAPHRPLVLISIGNGQFNSLISPEAIQKNIQSWGLIHAAPIVASAISASNKSSDFAIRNLIKLHSNHILAYYRLNINLPRKMHALSENPENIKFITTKAKSLLISQNKAINNIVELLLKNKKNKRLHKKINSTK